MVGLDLYKGISALATVAFAPLLAPPVPACGGRCAIFYAKGCAYIKVSLGP